MKRDVYKKLMNLGSAKADEILTEKVTEIKNQITNSRNNDEISQQLETLEQFAYKVSSDTLDIAGYLLHKEPLPPTDYTTDLGPYTGKTHKDLINKLLDLLDKIRYYQSEKILAIYKELFIQDGYEKTLEDKIRNMLEYNLDALQRIGYRTQIIGTKALKEIDALTDKEFQFFVDAARHLMATEGQMHHMKDENTLVWGSAPLPFTPELKEIRESVLTQISGFLHADITVAKKLRLIELAQGITYLPHQGEPSPELMNYIKENTQALISLYRDLLFDASQQLRAPLALTLEIEENLLRLRQNDKDDSITANINPILTALVANSTYATYRTLVGEELGYIDRGNDSFETIREEAKKDRESLLAKISSDNWREYYLILNEAAQSIEQVDDWKLMDYYGFISNLAADKPQIARTILEESFKENAPLSKAAVHFLIGFTRASHTAERDKTLQEIKKYKITFSFRLVCYAYTLKSQIDTRDIKDLSEIVTRSGGFAFIKAIPKIYYVDHLTMALSCALHKHPEGLEELFLKFFEDYKEDAEHILSSIAVELHGGGVQVADFTPAIKEAIFKELVEAEDLSHMDQEVLFKLVGEDISSLMELFKNRIKRAEAEPKTKRPLGYDAIPYHMDEGIKSAISESPQYERVFGELLDSFTPKWSKYNWEIASLIKAVGSYKEVFLKYIRKSDKIKLKNALMFCQEGIDSTDLEICFALVEKTSDQKIWNSIRNLLFTTGMVEGEYGLAESHEAKRDTIKAKYLNSANQRVRKFSEETIELLSKWAEEERRRSDEDKRLRKIEFER